MSEETDFYKILGIDRSASDDDIKRAFRQFSKKYHPDMQHGKTDAEKKEAEETFKMGQAAYECLSNPESRKTYDRYGLDGLRGASQQGGFGGGMPDGLAEFLRSRMGGFQFGFGMDGGFDPFSDGFHPFGGWKEKKRPPETNDAEDGKSFRIAMKIDLEDVIFGNEKEFTIDGYSVCPDCHGRKCEGYSECANCGGYGYCENIRGNVAIRTQCAMCGGSGYVLKNSCGTCGGTGLVKEKKTFKVKIPVGVPDGSTLRVKGGGIPGLNGGEDGNLLIVLDTVEHPVFKRVGDLDLEVDVFVNPLATVYGGEVKIPTPYKMVADRLFPGMKNGQRYRLGGYGIRRGSEKGSLIVRIVYDTIDASALDADADKALRKAILLMEKCGTKFLPGVRAQMEEISKLTKLPWKPSV